MKVLIVLAVLVLLVGLLMLLRVGGQVEYSQEGIKAWVRIGLVKMLVYPRKQKPKKKKKAEKNKREEKPPEEKSEPKEKEKKRGGMMKKALQEAPAILELVGEAVGRLRIEELTVEYTIPGRYDAASAAIQYGSVYATGGVLYPMLSDALDVKEWNVGAEIDYGEDKARVYLCLELSYRVGQLVVMGIHALKIYLSIRRQK